jgi:hypothetical protein
MHALRRDQRAVFMSLVAHGGASGRFWERLRQVVVHDAGLLRLFELDGAQVIYARVNPCTGAVTLIYVGQSKRARKRDSEHLVDGSMWMGLTADERRHVHAVKALWSDQLSGWGAWHVDRRAIGRVSPCPARPRAQPC